MFLVIYVLSLRLTDYGFQTICIESKENRMHTGRIPENMYRYIDTVGTNFGRRGRVSVLLILHTGLFNCCLTKLVVDDRNMRTSGHGRNLFGPGLQNKLPERK
jgi:hypothetical protein